MPNNPASRRAGATQVAAGNRIVRGAQLTARVSASATSTLSSISAANAASTTSTTGGDPLGGDLSGNYPNPSVVALHETTGGVATRLAVASVPASTILQRNGAGQIVGLSAASVLTFVGLSGGVTGTVPLAKLTAGGTNGSLTLVAGIVTAKTDPT